MLNDRQREFREQAHPERLDHIRYVSAPVGSGKTAAVIRHIRENHNECYIYVTPTRRLAREIHDRLMAELAELWHREKLLLIITEDDPNEVNPNQERVFDRVLNSINGRRAREGHILVITTETFRNILPNIEPNAKGDYHVFLDEGIDPVDSVSFSPGNQGLFLEPIDVGEDSSFSIADGGRELLEAVAKRPGRLAAMGREELDTANYRKLAKFLVSDIFDVYGTVGAKAIRAIALLRPDYFLPFKSVTIIMAIFQQSLLALFWQQKYGVIFQPLELNGLFDTHRVKGPSIRIFHLLHPDDTASVMNLKRDWETGEPNADDRGGRRVIDRAVQAVEDRYHDTCCWAANAFLRNDQNALTGERMPVKCAGIDRFKQFDNVVSMACINPQPWVKNLVTEHVDIADADLYELWKLSYTYQTIGRSSIRNRDVDRPIEVVVISKRCAEQIHELFEGSEIVEQLTDLPSYKEMKRQRGPAKNPNGIRYVRNDNSAWSKYLRTHPDNELTKEEWYVQIRLPRLQKRAQRV